MRYYHRDLCHPHGNSAVKDVTELQAFDKSLVSKINTNCQIRQNYLLKHNKDPYGILSFITENKGSSYFDERCWCTIIQKILHQHTLFHQHHLLSLRVFISANAGNLCNPLNDDDGALKCSMACIDKDYDDRFNKGIPPSGPLFLKKWSNQPGYQFF